MSKVIIYHNPKCSKSRETLALLIEKGIDPEIIEYLKTQPDRETLQDLCNKMSCDATGILRNKEKLYKEEYAGKNLDHSDLLQLMAQHPVLIERPIVVHKDKAAIGRPPESVLEIL